MSTPAFPNIYSHRKVAGTSSRACDICYKPSTSVLVTPENKDFFYVCPGHLKDAGFCTPIIDETAVAARKKKQMESEIKRVKEEFEEKQRKKKEKEMEKEDKNEKKPKANEKSVEEEKKVDTPTAEPEEEPRTFALKINFYKGRLTKKRNAETAKQQTERLRNPNYFPKVPQGPISGPSSPAPSTSPTS